MTTSRTIRLLLPLAAICSVTAACTTTWSGGEQNWNGEQQEAWASATQGSRLMPLTWFQALAQPDGDKPFADGAYLSQFRIVPQEGKLPIGFAVDRGSDEGLAKTSLRWFAGQTDREAWVGLNCAACHTGVIEYGGKDHRIDGAPALFDYQNFVEALDKALHQTLASANAPDAAGQARFAAFAAKILGDKGSAGAADTPANRAQLKTALGALVAWEDKVEQMNSTFSRYGYGRVDAFGHIFNKVALFNGAPNPTPNPASAPVSFPFLWDIYRHDYLQWNGIVEKFRIPLGGDREFDFGAMGRNTGEVLGVFGDVNVTKDYPGLGGYRSSVKVANLEALERLLKSLKAPKWPVELGAAGTSEQLAQGKALFEQHCQSCHAPQPGTAPYKVSFVTQTEGNPNNTDAWMACNSIRYTSAPGNLTGVPEGYLLSDQKYGTDPALLATMLATTVKGVLAHEKGKLVAQMGRVFLGFGGLPKIEKNGEEMLNFVDPVLKACYDAKNPLMRYKARPLDGIWATAPYLHNGSVPNLYQLLLPDSQRVKSFNVGTRRFDPKQVGYATDAGAPGNTFLFETGLKGNSNQGHNYGSSGPNAMSDADRWALVAYLKTL